MTGETLKFSTKYTVQSQYIFEIIFTQICSSDCMETLPEAMNCAFHSVPGLSELFNGNFLSNASLDRPLLSVTLKGIIRQKNA